MSPSCSSAQISGSIGRRNFGDSRTFNAVIGLLLIFACILRTSLPKMGVGANGEG